MFQNSSDFSYIEKLIYNYNFLEATNAISEISADLLTPEEKDLYSLLYAKLFLFSGQYQKAKKISKELFLSTKSDSFSPLFLESIIVLCQSLIKLGYEEQAEQYISDVINTMKEEDKKDKKEKKDEEENNNQSEIDFPSPIIKARFFKIQAQILRYHDNFPEALAKLSTSMEIFKKETFYSEILLNTCLLGNFLNQNGNTKESLKIFNKALAISEIEKPPLMRGMIFNGLGMVYMKQGKLDLAEEYFQKTLEIHKHKNEEHALRYIYNNLGKLARQRSEYNKAIDYFSKSVEYSRLEHESTELSQYLFNLFEVYIDVERISDASSIFQELRNLQLSKKDSKAIYYRTQIAHALLLRHNIRVSNLATAQSILKEFINKPPGDSELYLIVLMNYCEILILDLKMSKDPQIIIELNEYFQKLENIAGFQGSYYLLAEIALLRAKILLLNLDLAKARKILNDAQEIAENHGFNNLAMKISDEHDKILEQLSSWQQFSSQTTSIDQRIKLSGVSEQITKFLGRNKEKKSQISLETPLLLLILSEDGLALFSNPFNPQWSPDSQLFGGLISAFHILSKELFTHSFERAKFGQYNVIMSNDTSPFLLCYVYRGFSYSAQNHLKEFTQQLQSDSFLWKGLKESLKNGQISKNQKILLKKYSEMFLSPINEI
ncbi:MAG: tetratricopeptide repeat protein [Promethearchaeota archaeon]